MERRSPNPLKKDRGPCHGGFAGLAAHFSGCFFIGGRNWRDYGVLKRI